MWAEGLCVLRRYKRRHALPHLVVLALGTNWIVRRIDIERALTLLGPRRVLGLVTPRKKGGRVGAEPRVEKRAQRAQPHRIVVLDWVRRSAGHREYFDADHLHP